MERFLRKETKREIIEEEEKERERERWKEYQQHSTCPTEEIQMNTSGYEMHTVQ